MRILFFILVSFLISLPSSAFAEMVYVYRHSSSAESLDLQSIRRIFDGSDLSWDSGSNIVLLVDKLDKLDDETFFKFARISKSQFLSRWRIKFFSGRALIPIQAKNNAFALDILKTNPSAVLVSFKEIPEDELASDAKNVKVDKISY